MQVEKQAHLALIELTQAELKEFSRQLADVLKYFEQLKVVDVNGVKPMRHPLDVEMPLRGDKVVPFAKPQAILKSAPELQEGGFRVPPIL